MGNLETFYNGYKFRSRLEARWALFLDEANIEYQYEKEGFHLSNGRNYLPDFYLPQFNYWAEVKDPACDDEKFHEDIQQKVMVMVEDGLADNFIVLSEIPLATKEKNVFWFPAIHRSVRCCRKTDCDRVTFLTNDGAYIQDDYGEGCKQYTYDIFYGKYAKAKDLIPTFIESTQENHPSVNDEFSSENLLVARAYQRARSARYEHGECGGFSNV